MDKRNNEDGTTSYTLTAAEQAVLYGLLGYFLGRTVGQRKGRLAMAKEIKKTGITQR